MRRQIGDGFQYHMGARQALTRAGPRQDPDGEPGTGRAAGLDVVRIVTYPRDLGRFKACHIREGKHDIGQYDWNQYMNFADRHLTK